MRNRIVRNLVMMLLIAAALISCNDVFYSGVSGTVRDKDTSEGISGINVYAYTSEDAWNNAYNSWQKGTVFEDKSCPFRSTTNANGEFNVSKVVWTTNKPTWSKDYDSSNIYLIFFSEEYGIAKAGPVAVVSGVTNQSAVTVELERQMQNSSVTLSFNDMSSAGSNYPVDSTLSFTYSYNNGYRTITKNASVDSGTATIELEYPKGEKCILSVSNVKDASDCFTYVPAEDNQHKFEIQDSRERVIIPMKRNGFLLSDDAIYGELIIPVDAAAIDSLAAMHVYTKIGGVTYEADLSGPEFVGGATDPANGYVNYTYSGLALNVFIPAVSDGTPFGFNDIKIDVYVSTNSETAGTYKGSITLSKSSSSLMCNLN